MTAQRTIPLNDLTTAELRQAESFNRAVTSKSKAVNSRRVLVTAVEFEVDAYSAAVEGILKSIRLGIASDSCGDGEAEILGEVRDRLTALDPAIRL